MLSSLYENVLTLLIQCPSMANDVQVSLSNLQTFPCILACSGYTLETIVGISQLNFNSGSGLTEYS